MSTLLPTQQILQKIADSNLLISEIGDALESLVSEKDSFTSADYELIKQALLAELEKKLA